MKNLFIFLLFVLSISITNKIVAQSYSTIIIDKNQSEYFGANNLIMLQKSVYLFQDKYIPDTLIKENNFFKKTVGFGYRMGKLFILDFQEDFFIALLQHEAIGHAARYREFGHEANSFQFSPFFPFGTGGGSASPGKLKPGNTISPHESVTKILGGNEANLVLANTLSSQFLLDDTLHFRQALLYLTAQNNLLNYIRITKYSKNGGDVSAYISSINGLYGKNSTSFYDIKKISRQSLVSLLNPTQLYSVYTVLFQYGIKGKKQLNKIPMIKMGNVRYLPAFNYNLTPFGSEYILSNIVRHKHRLYSLDFNLGDNTFNKFYGGSLKIFNLIDTKRIGINLNCNVWNQPELELKKEFANVTNYPSKIGGAVKVDLMIRPFKLKNKLGIFLQTGYKSKGYVMGEDLAETFILRCGISLHVN